jgi:hypothetical protein
MRYHHSQIGGDEGVFEFLKRFAGKFGRTRDDAFDFVRQLAVGLGKAGFEFGEETHSLIVNRESRMATSERSSI